MAVAWVAIVVLWAGAIAPYGRLGYERLAREGGNDFTIFYYTGQRAASGRALYGPLSPAEFEHRPYTTLGNINLPHTSLIFLPLARLPYGSAAAAWALVSLLALAVSIRLVARELAPRPGVLGTVLGVTVFVASAPFLSAVVAGEISILLTVPFTLGWRAARRDRWTRAGAYLGVCAAIKPFLGLYVVWLLLARRWRGFAAALIAFAVAIAAGVAVFGVASYGDWLATVTHARWFWATENASIRGFSERLLVGGHGLTGVLPAPELADAVSWLGAGAVLLFTYRAAVRGGRCETDRDVALLFCASLLVSPLGWIYYLPMALGALLAVWMASRAPSAHGRVWLLAGGVGLLLPLAYTEAGQPSAMATLLFACAYFWSVLVLWMGLLRVRRATPDDPTLRPSGAADRATPSRLEAAAGSTIP